MQIVPYLMKALSIFGSAAMFLVDLLIKKAFMHYKSNT
ncbi:hypothetical protein IMCC1989_502 [gamma proteobacterium IMCC1989]|nr:hypothetical protein IMCC1989_502 [gamma proteobacterium IMCC1989]